MTKSNYEYAGAAALVALHGQHLRAFLATWRRAEEMAVQLPDTADPNYASREALLLHVMRAAAHYLNWTCAQLELPSPALDEGLDPTGFAGRAEQYMETVLEAWDRSLRSLTEAQAEQGVYASAWGTTYCIDAMLEHAVMHPIRHGYQLERLMEALA